MSYEYHFKRYFSFDATERRGFVITTIILSVIMFLFFAKFYWQDIELNAANIFSRMITMIVLVAIILFVFIAITKIIAIRKRYTAKYKSWFEGLLIGFVLSFITNSYLPIFFPGYIETKTIDRLRRGVVLPGENKTDIFFILATAPLACIFLSIIFQMFYISTGVYFFQYGMIISALFSFFSLLPTPKNIGIYMFYTKKDYYFFLFSFSLAFALATIISAYYALIIAVLGAAILTFIFNKYLRKHI